VRWKDTVEQLGLAGVTFHDLRHSGNTLAARCGVSTRDLMARMGHDSPPAAILYQHATTEADARIAAALDAERTADDAELTATTAGPTRTTKPVVHLMLDATPGSERRRHAPTRSDPAVGATSLRPPRSTFWDTVRFVRGLT
jgi:hypothetical protein